MSGIKARSGGKRRKAGRLPQVFHISKEAARSLSILTGQQKMLRPDLTELEVLEALIDKAWRELDEVYEQGAEIALLGERDVKQQEEGS